LQICQNQQPNFLPALALRGDRNSFAALERPLQKDRWPKFAELSSRSELRETRFGSETNRFGGASSKREDTVNAANDYYNEQEIDYQVKHRKPEPEEPRRERRPEHTRAARPSGFNGFHRRRNKRHN
jgi:hypothetical protein